MTVRRLVWAAVFLATVWALELALRAEVAR